MKPVRIAIFASGSGTNAENIAVRFAGSKDISVAYILSNKPDAFVLERAKKLNIPTLVFNRQEFYHTDHILQFLKKESIEWIVLAGFLWLIPAYLVDAYPGRIINIHPALLPKYGGKGMYGEKVHRAVIENSDKESGITIHYVNKEYDKGDIIFQTRCKVEPSDTPETLAAKVHQLEYIHFPAVIEKIILS
ncbi:MAG TPA: phosphoribosylglycinamide formyltransferase [Bacteroidales bacterium]|nr:phosphoribosylglycinamide formyltransferase [Bacteroidales bacterium]